MLLVAVSLTAVLVAALPAFLEVARAARSAEKLFDTLRRDLPATLEAIRLTGMEISELTDDVTDSVKSAGHVVKQVDKSIDGAKKQAYRIEVRTRSVFAGVKAAWRNWNRDSFDRRSPESFSPSQARLPKSRTHEASLEKNTYRPKDRKQGPPYQQGDISDTQLDTDDYEQLDSDDRQH
jgi:Asp-tRNA(Asn)/Glu-tRNA(Gln) amidotransferase A subunit family amidase